MGGSIRIGGDVAAVWRCSQVNRSGNVRRYLRELLKPLKNLSASFNPSPRFGTEIHIEGRCNNHQVEMT
jgi:hypothetical protein